jgi:probable rRNA maturation factor
MRSLNLRFRRKNAATDVLSFAPWMSSDRFAGDIAISGEMAARNARALEHSVFDEVRILVLHGMLHLAGYDHERDDGQMAARESELRRQLGLPESLIQRTIETHRRQPRATRAKTPHLELNNAAQGNQRRSSTSFARART